MKKVLIITFFFHQKEEIGTVRLRGLAKYLPKFGWEPTILTIKSDERSASDLHIVETEYSDLVASWESKLGLNSKEIKLKTKKGNKGFFADLIKIWYEIFAFPDPEKYWFKPAVEAGSELLEKEHFNAILSSSSPVTCHLIANELKNRYNIPWMADLRDLWTLNHYYDFSRFRKYRELKLEKKTLSNANILSTVSIPWANQLQDLHNINNVVTIMNGFDPESNDEVTELDTKFSIVYTGRIYEGKMDPEILFKAISQLDEDEEIDMNDFLIEFYGKEKELLEKQLLQDVKKYNLENIVKIHGQISHNGALNRQKRSQLLLLLTWNNPKGKGHFPGKIFEYLAAKRPIISVGSLTGDVNELINKTKSGMSFNDVEELKNTIKTFYYEYKRYGEVRYSGIPEEIEKYSHEHMAKKFSNALNKISQ